MRLSTTLGLATIAMAMVAASNGAQTQGQTNQAQRSGSQQYYGQQSREQGTQQNQQSDAQVRRLLREARQALESNNRQEASQKLYEATILLRQQVDESRVDEVFQPEEASEARQRIQREQREERQDQMSSQDRTQGQASQWGQRQDEQRVQSSRIGQRSEQFQIDAQAEREIQQRIKEALAAFNRGDREEAADKLEDAKGVVADELADENINKSRLEQAARQLEALEDRIEGGTVDSELALQRQLTPIYRQLGMKTEAGGQMLSQARSQGSGAVTLNAQARQRVEQYLNEAQRQIQANQHDEAAEQVEHAEAAIRAEARQAQGEERQQLRAIAQRLETLADQLEDEEQRGQARSSLAQLRGQLGVTQSSQSQTRQQNWQTGQQGQQDAQRQQRSIQGEQRGNQQGQAGQQGQWTQSRSMTDLRTTGTTQTTQSQPRSQWNTGQSQQGQARSQWSQGTQATTQTQMQATSKVELSQEVKQRLGMHIEQAIASQRQNNRGEVVRHLGEARNELATAARSGQGAQQQAIERLQRDLQQLSTQIGQGQVNEQQLKERLGDILKSAGMESQLRELNQPQGTSGSQPQSPRSDVRTPGSFALVAYTAPGQAQDREPESNQSQMQDREDSRSRMNRAGQAPADTARRSQQSELQERVRRHVMQARTQINRGNDDAAAREVREAATLLEREARSAQDRPTVARQMRLTTTQLETLADRIESGEISSEQEFRTEIERAFRREGEPGRIGQTWQQSQERSMTGRQGEQERSVYDRPSQSQERDQYDARDRMGRDDASRYETDRTQRQSREQRSLTEDEDMSAWYSDNTGRSETRTMWSAEDQQDAQWQTPGDEQRAMQGRTGMREQQANTRDETRGKMTDSQWQSRSMRGDQVRRFDSGSANLRESMMGRSGREQATTMRDAIRQLEELGGKIERGEITSTEEFDRAAARIEQLLSERGQGDMSGQSWQPGGDRAFDREPAGRQSWERDTRSGTWENNTGWAEGTGQFERGRQDQQNRQNQQERMNRGSDDRGETGGGTARNQ